VTFGGGDPAAAGFMLVNNAASHVGSRDAGTLQCIGLANVTNKA